MVGQCRDCNREIEKIGTRIYCTECAKIRKRINKKNYYLTHYDKLRESHSEYYRKHREEAREYNRQYFLAHREKHREDSKRWKKEHPETIRRLELNWSKANPEKRKEIVKRSRAKYPERCKKSRREWNKANPEKIAIANARRNSRMKNAPGSFTSDELKAKFKEYGNKCAHCNTVEKKLTIDHIVPLTKNGTNYIINIQPLCMDCNRKKSNKFIG